jgi:hypothetical protein
MISAMPNENEAAYGGGEDACSLGATRQHLEMRPGFCEGPFIFIDYSINHRNSILVCGTIPMKILLFAIDSLGVTVYCTLWDRRRFFRRLMPLLSSLYFQYKVSRTRIWYYYYWKTLSQFRPMIHAVVVWHSFEWRSSNTSLNSFSNYEKCDNGLSFWFRHCTFVTRVDWNVFFTIVTVVFRHDHRVPLKRGKPLLRMLRFSDIAMTIACDTTTDKQRKKFLRQRSSFLLVL